MTELREVLYCGVCSYPPEFCEFSGKLKRCKIWLHDNHPELFHKLYGTNSDAKNNDDDDIDTAVEVTTGKFAESSIGEERETKLEKDLLKLQTKQENKEQRDLAKKLSSKVIIKREAITKRTSIVEISGLDGFEIDIKNLDKILT